MLTSLEREIADIIVECTGIEPLELDVLDPEQLLFNGEMGLDSIDALELALAISQRYGFQLRSDNEDNRRAFASLRALSAYVEQHKTSG